MVAAGPAVNLLIAFVIIWVLFMQDGQTASATIRCTRSCTASAAAGVLRPGDQIVSVDGVQRRTLTQLRDEIAKHHCAGTQVNGCVAATPAMIVVAPRRPPADVQRSIRATTPPTKRPLVGFEFGQVQPIGARATRRR